VDGELVRIQDLSNIGTRRMPAAARLPWYAQHFEMVEVKSTFYSVPIRGWSSAGSKHRQTIFVFDVKLHQLLSGIPPPRNVATALQPAPEVTRKGRSC
jgi:uncharacterized protein YecE (DUF72 family)